MRFTVSSFLLILSVAGLASTATPAAAATDRYCLRGDGWGYPGNCAFATFAQCRATAAGTRATCGINPRYSFARQRGPMGGRSQGY